MSQGRCWHQSRRAGRCSGTTRNQQGLGHKKPSNQVGAYGPKSVLTAGTDASMAPDCETQARESLPAGSASRSTSESQRQGWAKTSPRCCCKSDRPGSGRTSLGLGLQRASLREITGSRRGHH